MQSKLVQELYRQTKKRVVEIFPESVLVECSSTGRRVWELNRVGAVKLFLALDPSPKDDSFVLDLAWSIHGLLPEYSGFHPDEDPGKGKMFFGLSRFWRRYGSEHRWYFGSNRGSEEIRLPECNLPSELEHYSMESIMARPENKELAEKAKELGINFIRPRAEPLEIKFASIKPQIEDAFAKLEEYGVPYLKQIAERYGTELKTT